ncbi:MAG: hypothetical protein HUJ65_04460 [Oscillospiraceae bacterium]|nr:hypothetical protein [Oscillospiraceae bacterium]
MKNHKIDLALWARRLLAYCVGIYCIAIGVVLSSKSSLGVSPVTCIASVMANIASDLGLTFFDLGTCTTISYCIYIVVELIILRRDFKLIMLLQIGVSFLFGLFVKLAGVMLAFVPAPEAYLLRLVLLAVSIPFIAFGVMTYIATDLIPTPSDGLTLAVRTKTGMSVPNAKNLLDCTYAAFAAALSLIYFGRLIGVREGTIIAALTVGPVMKIFLRFCEKPLLRFVGREKF